MDERNLDCMLYAFIPQTIHITSELLFFYFILNIRGVGLKKGFLIFRRKGTFQRGSDYYSVIPKFNSLVLVPILSSFT